MATDTSNIMQLKYLLSSDLSLVYPTKSTHIRVWLQRFRPRSAEALRKTQSVHFEEICDILELKDKEIGSTSVSFILHRIAQSSSGAAGNGYSPFT